MYFAANRSARKKRECYHQHVGPSVVGYAKALIEIQWRLPRQDLLELLVAKPQRLN